VLKDMVHIITTVLDHIKNKEILHKQVAINFTYTGSYQFYIHR